MARIILHVGDIVTHSTLGEGVVTIVDDEYCTIKFASKELTFRLPDAFEKGFLSSDSAQIIYDEEDENDDEVEEEEEEESPQGTEQIIQNKPQVPAKRGIRVTAIIAAIIMGLIFVPIGIQLFKTGSKYDEVFFYVIGFIFCCAPIVGFLFGSIGSGSTSSSGGRIHYDHTEDFGASAPFLGNKKNEPSMSNDERIRREIYAQQDENLSILEDMIQMHSVNPDADLEEHYGWDHKIDYDQDGDNDDW